MTAKFPVELRPLVDQAIFHLWDIKYPRPDLTPLSDWLGIGSDGWDYVVDGLISPYIYIDEAKEFFSDEMLIDYGYEVEPPDITDAIRLTFARERIEHLISVSMDSMHVIELESKKMPPAVICILMYFHPQGGAFFDPIKVDFTVEDYLDSTKDDIILDKDQLSDQLILQAWVK